MNHRMRSGISFEDDVLKRIGLINPAWHACHFGQGQLDERLRRGLLRYDQRHHCKTFARWMPDIIAARDDGEHRLLIDAKTSTKETPNWAIEQDSIDALTRISSAFQIPCIYVFTDFSAIDVSHVEVLGSCIFPGSGNGSGTPYRLLPKHSVRASLETYIA